MTTLAPSMAALFDRGVLPSRVQVARDTAAFRRGEVLTWCEARGAFMGSGGFCALACQILRHWGDVYDHAPAVQQRLAI